MDQAGNPALIYLLTCSPIYTSFATYKPVYNSVSTYLWFTFLITHHSLRMNTLPFLHILFPVACARCFLKVPDNQPRNYHPVCRASLGRVQSGWLLPRTCPWLRLPDWPIALHDPLQWCMHVKRRQAFRVVKGEPRHSGADWSGITLP